MSRHRKTVHTTHRVGPQVNAVTNAVAQIFALAAQLPRALASAEVLNAEFVTLYGLPAATAAGILHAFGTAGRNQGQMQARLCRTVSILRGLVRPIAAASVVESDSWSLHPQVVGFGQDDSGFYTPSMRRVV